MPYDELSSGPNPFPSQVDNALPSRREKDDQQSIHSRDRLELPSDAQDFDTTDSDTDSSSVTFAANPEYYNHLMTNIALWQRRSTTTPQPGDLWSILDPDDLATMSWDEWIPLVFDSPSDRSMAGYAGRDSYSWSNGPPLQTLRPAHLLRREALDAEPGPALPAPPFPNPLIPRICCLDNGSFSILAVPVDVEKPLIWTLTAPILGDVHIGIHIRMEYASTWVCGTVRSIFRLHDDCVTFFVHGIVVFSGQVVNSERVMLRVTPELARLSMRDWTKHNVTKTADVTMQADAFSSWEGPRVAMAREEDA
ncbi:hypothetical protein PUNSTDRAFT_139581 [Punctularia strigosozonata HHB-11173 SS5]|uniref:Uncharacterized protein n=1 Tax=Punctularia strigosozonata (strain HHB-11173) TaxID=741275 RepID=R7S0M6_PUNST|nr:uncharacterized protein PUNSTDRAFT_139581 [Punctularia strigosozonata HHB-11173 SS5]EIN03404.1 hypothetical protein PUNSTDRAFT_139581 [Punctularia strigosozonata HHB-11173 SS5]